MTSTINRNETSANLESQTTSINTLDTKLVKVRGKLKAKIYANNDFLIKKKKNRFFSGMNTMLKK